MLLALNVEMRASATMFWCQFCWLFLRVYDLKSPIALHTHQLCGDLPVSVLIHAICHHAVGTAHAVKEAGRHLLSTGYHPPWLTALSGLRDQLSAERPRSCQDDGIFLVAFRRAFWSYDKPEDETHAACMLTTSSSRTSMWSSFAALQWPSSSRIFMSSSKQRCFSGNFRS